MTGSSNELHKSPNIAEVQINISLCSCVLIEHRNHYQRPPIPSLSTNAFNILKLYFQENEGEANPKEVFLGELIERISYSLLTSIACQF